MEPLEAQTRAKDLQSWCQDDLTDSFINECTHFRSYLLSTAEAPKSILKIRAQ